jgi:lipopolysaccharide/colanic/teichoic acid biosynthesis glycosyltransferase
MIMKFAQNKITNIKSFLKETLSLLAFVQILIWIFVLLLYLGVSISVVQIIGLLIIFCTFIATLLWSRLYPKLMSTIVLHFSKQPVLISYESIGMSKNTKILYSIAKRAFDISCALIGLIILSPIFFVCIILAKFQSPGSAFYRAKRVGRYGRIFLMYKFRTMVVNAASMGSSLTTYEDPRITKTGNFLRRTKLDELPQLLNVLKGDMSIIGPRPEAPVYVKYYTEEQRRVLSVRPGITGPAQLENRDEELKLKGQSDPEQYYITQLLPEKLNIDLNYIENRNLGLDLKVIFKTIWAVIRR